RARAAPPRALPDALPIWKEIAELVRQLAPLPDVPARVEPLGPVGAASATPEHSANPSWHAFAQSMAPVVRVLEPGLRPADWIDDVQELDVLKSDDATIALARAPLSDGGNGSTPALARAPLSDGGNGSTPAPAR